MSFLWTESVAKEFEASVLEILNESQSSEQQKYYHANEGAEPCPDLTDCIAKAPGQCTNNIEEKISIAIWEQLETVGKNCPEKRAAIISALMRIRCVERPFVSGSYLMCLDAVVNACTEKDDAVLDVFLSLSKSSDDRVVRGQAFQKLEVMFQLFTQRRDEIISAVLQCCGDVSSEVRHQAVHQVSELAMARPGRAREIQDVVIRLCADSEDTVRYHAFLELKNTVVLIPDSVEAVCETLLEMSNAEDYGTKCSALVFLAQQVHLWPEKADMIVEECLLWIQSPDFLMQAVYLFALVNLMEWCPSRRREIAEVFLQQLDEPDVYEGIFFFPDCPLEVAAKGCPETANLIVATSIAKIRQEDHIALVALQQLSELCTTDLECMNEVVDVLIAACSHSCSERRITALNGLADAIEFCPDKSAMIIETLIRACNDESGRVKASALCQLAKAARLKPDWPEEIVEVLLRLCAGADEVLRALALDELAHTASACPQKATLIFTRLLHGCVDDSLYVRGFAKRNLGHVLQFCPDMALKILQKLIQERDAKQDVAGAGVERLDFSRE